MTNDYSSIHKPELVRQQQHLREFGEFGGVWLDTWKASMTYNLAVSDTTQGDNVGYRIQQALNGFGGPR